MPLIVMVGLVPCTAKLGFSVAVGCATTVNPPTSVAISELVVSVTFLEAGAAVGSIGIRAFARVGVFTVKELTVIPAPKLAVVVPWMKCVNCALRVMVSEESPCLPDPGTTEVIAGTPATIVKPFGEDEAISPLVVIVTV